MDGPSVTLAANPQSATRESRGMTNMPTSVSLIGSVRAGCLREPMRYPSGAVVRAPLAISAGMVSTEIGGLDSAAPTIPLVQVPGALATSPTGGVDETWNTFACRHMLMCGTEVCLAFR